MGLELGLRSWRSTVGHPSDSWASCSFCRLCCSVLLYPVSIDQQLPFADTRNHVILLRWTHLAESVALSGVCLFVSPAVCLCHCVYSYWLTKRQHPTRPATCYGL